MSLELVETKKDIDINFNLQECKFGDFFKEQVEEKFKKLEFDSLINRLLSL